MSAETDDILAKFTDMLRIPTGDGASKRDAGTKVHWMIDTSHPDAAAAHYGEWLLGHTFDTESGAHHLIHAAWRFLAIAAQETA